MRRKWNSLFTRLILIFLAAVLPIQIGNQVLNNWLYGNIRNNAVTYASAKVYEARTELEEAVEIIRDQTQFILQNSKVRDFFVFRENLTNAERYEMIKNVMDLLYYLHSVNPYLAEIRLCYPESGMEITASGQYKAIESEMYAALSGLERTAARLYDREGVLHFGSLVASAGGKYMYLDAELNMDHITEGMRLADPSGGTRSMIVNHQAGRMYPEQDSVLPEDMFALLDSGTEENTEVTLNGTEYLMIASYSDVLACSFVELLPVRQVFALPILLRRYVSLLTALVFAGIVLYSVIIYRKIQFPVRSLVRHFEEATAENLSEPVNSNSYIYEFRMLADSYNRMNERVQKLIRDNYEATIRCQQAELKQLHAQINPHFLYNSFFILRHSITEGRYAHAERLTDYLGKYFEYITDQSHTMVRLQKEYDFAVTYLNIQLIRFEGGIAADIEALPDEIARLSVPHLILQPLFENALEHGIVTRNGEGIIRLRFEINARYVRILVEDNGSLLTDEQLQRMRDMLLLPTPEQEQHALVNTHMRLKSTWGDSCGLAFDRSELGGLRVTMTVGRTGFETAEEKS